MGDYLYQGKQFESVELDVQRSPSLEFKLGRDAVRKRNAPIDLIVVHWTAGEGSAKNCFNVLKNRKSPKAPRGLSVQFYGDYYGKLTQYCDLDLVALHAGAYNGRSIGIEIQNKGVPPENKKFPRGRYLTELKGKKRSLLMFNLDQVEMLLVWLDDMCSLLDIPRKLPRDKHGEVPRVLMTPKAIAAHKGVIFHYHLSGPKIDPGTQLIDTLVDEGY